MLIGFDKSNNLAGGIFSGHDIALSLKSLTLRQCTVATGAGGAVYIAAGGLTVRGPTEVDDCVASGGGDIAFVQGDVTMEETNILGSSQSLFAKGHAQIDSLTCARASSACYATGHSKLVARAVTCPRGTGFLKAGVKEGCGRAALKIYVFHLLGFDG